MPPPEWNGKDPRAIIMAKLRSTDPDRLKLSKSSPYAVLASSGIVAVGIYGFDSALPLHHVPHGFKKNRVPAGWYAPRLIAGTRFAVVVTPIHYARDKVKKHGANILVVDVSVAGRNVHPPGRMLDLNKDHEYVIHGYTLAQQSEGGSSSQVHTHQIAPFKFTDENIVVQVSLRIANATRYARPESDLKRPPERPGPSAAGPAASPIAVRRYTHKEVPVLENIRPLEDMSITINLVNHEWLFEHGVFKRSDIEPARWLNRQGAHYLQLHNVVAQDEDEAE